MWKWVKDLLGLDGDKYGYYYVYELQDPRFDPPYTFYVGKGSRGRMFQHEKELRRLLKAGTKMRLKAKHKRILEIEDSGHTTRYVIVFRTNNEEEAFQVESARIHFYGLEKLLNETYGYRPKAVRRKLKKTA